MESQTMRLLIKRVTFQFNNCTRLGNSLPQPSLHLLIRTSSSCKSPQIACTECKIECMIVIDIFVRSKGNHMMLFWVKKNTNLFPLSAKKSCACYRFVFLPFRFSLPILFWCTGEWWSTDRRQSGRFPHPSLVCFRTNEPINLIVILLHQNAVVDLKKKWRKKSGKKEARHI